MSPLPLPEPLRGEFSVSEAQRRLQSFAGEAVPLVWKRDAEHGGREILDSRSTLQCSSTTCSLFCQVKWGEILERGDEFVQFVSFDTAHEQTCLEHSCLQRPCTRAQVAETMPKAQATTFSTQKGAMKALKAFAEKVLGPHIKLTYLRNKAGNHVRGGERTIVCGKGGDACLFKATLNCKQGKQGYFHFVKDQCILKCTCVPSSSEGAQGTPAKQQQKKKQGKQRKFKNTDPDYLRMLEKRKAESEAVGGFGCSRCRYDASGCLQCCKRKYDAYCRKHGSKPSSPFRGSTAKAGAGAKKKPATAKAGAGAKRKLDFDKVIGGTHKRMKSAAHKGRLARLLPARPQPRSKAGQGCSTPMLKLLPPPPRPEERLTLVSPPSTPPLMAKVRKQAQLTTTITEKSASAVDAQIQTDAETALAPIGSELGLVHFPTRESSGIEHPPTELDMVRAELEKGNLTEEDYYFFKTNWMRVLLQSAERRLRNS